jgi:hypothetical protein
MVLRAQSLVSRDCPRVKKRFFERPASFRTCGLHEGVGFARALGFGFASRGLALLLGGEQRRDLVNSRHDARAGVSSHIITVPVTSQKQLVKKEGQMAPSAARI